MFSTELQNGNAKQPTTKPNTHFWFIQGTTLYISHCDTKKCHDILFFIFVMGTTSMSHCHITGTLSKIVTGTSKYVSDLKNQRTCLLFEKKENLENLSTGN